MESSALAVKELIKQEVSDWDDDVAATALFKAFSGQRADWEPKYRFWKNLILKISRHLRLFLISPSQVKNEWFNRGGLTPLCIDHVLSLMYNEGELMLPGELVDPTSGRIAQLFTRFRNLMVRSTMATPELMLEQDYVILVELLSEKANEVIKKLSEMHWTSSCIITMRKFQEICGGTNEASAILSFLSGSGKAQYLSITKKEFLEGVKISLSTTSLSAISSLDCDVLHLIWTTGKLQKQIDMINQRYETSRKLALASMKSGNKKVALRHMRELKLASESREKCMSLLNRVEEVLDVIANAESTKKVSEAIQIAAHTMKQNKITAEEVENCLEELDESINVQKQVEKSLELMPSYMDMEDQDIEEEFNKLQSEVESKKVSSTIQKTATSEASTHILIDSMLNLNLQEASSKEPTSHDTVVPVKANYTEFKEAALETA